MRLKPCRKIHRLKLFFVPMDEDINDPRTLLPPKDRKALPAKGWKSQSYSFARIWRNKQSTSAICELKPFKNYNLEIIKIWHALHPIYLHAQNSGGLPLHAGLAVKGGKGILFAAPGNTGKSTCCRRIPAPWKALCDDEVLIVRDKHKKYSIHPFPTWSDHLMRKAYHKSWETEKSVALAAIFFLGQAKEDQVSPIGQGQASILINNAAIQICRRDWRGLSPEEERKRKSQIFKNACAMAKIIPCYILRVSLTGKFWREIEKVLHPLYNYLGCAKD